MAPLCLFKIVSFLICVLDYSHIDDASHVFVFGNVPVHHHHPWALFHSSNWTDKYAYRLPHFLSLFIFGIKNNPFWEPSYIQNMMRKYDMFNVHVSASFDFALSFYLVVFFSSQIFLNLRHHRFALFANDTAHILFSHITHGHCLFKWIEISTTLNNLQKFLMDDLISIEMAVKTKRSFLRSSCPRDEK